VEDLVSGRGQDRVGPIGRRRRRDGPGRSGLAVRRRSRGRGGRDLQGDVPSGGVVGVARRRGEATAVLPTPGTRVIDPVVGHPCRSGQRAGSCPRGSGQDDHPASRHPSGGDLRRTVPHPVADAVPGRPGAPEAVRAGRDPAHRPCPFPPHQRARQGGPLLAALCRRHRRRSRRRRPAEAGLPPRLDHLGGDGPTRRPPRPRNRRGGVDRPRRRHSPARRRRRRVGGEPASRSTGCGVRAVAPQRHRRRWPAGGGHPDCRPRHAGGALRPLV
jgi:hypothetical protein